MSIISTQEVTLPDIEYYREKFNPVRDILSMPPENWEIDLNSRPRAGRSDDGRYLTYKISGKFQGDEALERKYVFTVRVDLMLAMQVGTPKLEVFGPIADDWKPIRDELMVYEGDTAAKLFSMVRRSFMPSTMVDPSIELSGETLTGIPSDSATEI